jgi:alpha-ketoglutarate-dependent taurine dioxygenase
MGTPFDLDDEDSYGRWRARKLARYPNGPAELTVPVAGLGAVGDREREAILDRCRQANMAIYSCRDDREAEPRALRAFAAEFGLRSFDRHLCADDTGVTALSVAETGRRRGYIPYSDQRLSWHTDGYYNDEAKRIRAVVLHCARDAAAGGENALLDHEIAYIHLRDADPNFIEALMHPDAMTIPANREGGEEIRPARVGPVFTIDPATGALHMRFSARKRNIVWRDDAATRAAVALLNELLSAPDGPVIRCRLAPGQGIISNNVLHNRSAFQDDPMERRLVYRMRFLDRIAGTGAQAAT